MAINAIPCGHATCSHTSANATAHAMHGSLHFTASVMGNPEYLDAVGGIEQAPDQRMDGIERVNSFHAAAHEERTVRQMGKWSR